MVATQKVDMASWVDMVTGWSNDGMKVVFTSGRKNAPYPDLDQLWEISTEGQSSPFDLPRAANGKFSPDGLQFVYEQISPWEHEFRITEEGKIIPPHFDLKPLRHR
jgi:tricorn protease